MSTDDFFNARTDWARRKHLIVSYYLDPAVKKLRYASRERQVFVLDGFAGPGVYEDRTDGSPMYTGRLAEECRTISDPIDLFVRNVELDPTYFQKLETVTAPWVNKGYVKNLNGPFRDKLPEVLRDAGQSPLFAFLDPFKPAQLEFNDLLPLFKRAAKTEVCAVFFTNMVRRNLKSLRPESHADEKFRATLSGTMTRVFGSSDWERLVAQDRLDYHSIIECLSQSILSHARFGFGNSPGYVAYKPVYARKNGHIKYHIVYWTRHMDGVLLMNDSFVNETGNLEEVTERQIALAAEEKRAGQGLFDFSEPEQMSAKDSAAVASFNALCDSIIRIGRATPSKVWTREELIQKSIQMKFGEFRKTIHRRAILALVERPATPKIVPVGINPSKAGKWTLNDGTPLRFQLD